MTDAPEYVFDSVCTDEAIANALRVLTAGEYDGTLSTCLGIDEDSPLVDAVLTAVDK